MHIQIVNYLINLMIKINKSLTDMMIRSHPRTTSGPPAAPAGTWGWTDGSNGWMDGWMDE